MSSRARWESAACALRGHATYAPDEEALATRLSIDTPRGEAWLCLRCGTYVPGPASGSGPAQHAPIVLNGTALRDAFILRTLAVERGLRALLLFAVAWGVWQFDGARDSIRRTIDTYLPLLVPLENQLRVNLADAAAMHWIQSALNAPATTVFAVAGFVGVYGLLQTLESVGLWSMRRWGEYVAVVATSLFIPFEVYEIVDKVTVLRVLALVVNVFLVAYLVFTKRLFGARGGRRAYDAARAHTSLIEVEAAAASGPDRSATGQPPQIGRDR